MKIRSLLQISLLLSLFGLELNSQGLAQQFKPIDNGYELVYTNLSQPGMSGGPVLDTNGRVIGIHASAEGERYQLVNQQ